MYDDTDAILMPFSEVRVLAAQYQEYVNGGGFHEVPETTVLVGA